MLAQADKYWTENRLDQAQQSFEAAVAAEPRSAATLLRLAGFQLANKKMEASIASYKQAIGLEPENARAWIGLGMAYLHTGKPDLARAAFNEAIRIEPKRKERLDPLIAKLALH